MGYRLATMCTVAVVAGVALACALAPCAALSEDGDFVFAKIVRITPNVAVGNASAKLLTKKLADGGYQMILSNIEAAGMKREQEMSSRISGEDLSLVKSAIQELSTGNPVVSMERKAGAGLLDPEGDAYVYKEFGDSGATITEPHTKYKVVDFLSVLLVAAKYVHDGAQDPLDLSLLFERSVKHVQLVGKGPVQLGDQEGYKLRLAPPENPDGGFAYVIARSKTGEYYPARIELNESSLGAIQLIGEPQ